ncbi:MAG: glycosyltransferase [Rhodoferax sp.]|nr:glycosyltransferase [Rhodoferax sp.]
MLVINIMGGLGNQIAQYLYGRCCADQLGVELKLDLRAYGTYKLHAYGLEKFNIRAEPATDTEITLAQATGVVRERSLMFDPELAAQVRDGVYLDGYWGDYRYTLPRLAQLQAEFLPTQALHPDNLALMVQIEQTESVSLHIRRGDYVTNPNCVVLPLTYYEDALAEVTARIPNAHVYIFSDDMPWAEANLHPNVPHTYVKGNDASRNLDDFELMRSCKHHIVANSTFSGWAAMLDGKAGNVIAPQQYFAPLDPYLLSTFGRIDQPIWPPHWLSMPIRQAAAPHRLPANIAGGYSTGKPIVVGVWNYYEELTTDGFIFKNSNASIGHDLLKPWCDLHAYGQANGMRFVTVDQPTSLDELDLILFQDRPRHSNPMVDRLLALNIPKYLCIFETEVIKPDNWELAFHQRMDRILTWSDAHVDQRRYAKINFAIDPESPFDFEVLKTAFYQRKLCTLIAGAKSSNHPNELYSARLRSIDWLQRHATKDFDFYGMGWNAEAFPTYCGPVRDKLSVLARYRFAICYENAANYPGYITEKILDCFRAGVVPVYLGAPNIAQWIPADCFVDRNAFDSEDALLQFLAAMDAETHGGYMDRIRALLASAEIYPFTIECFVTTVSGLIAKDVKNRRGDCPDVTVVIPAYNYGRFLGQAIASALAQQGTGQLEVLVFDNASTDETPAIAAEFANDTRFRCMRNQRNIGAPRNWANALQIASGRYLAVLSADDFFQPGHLQKMVGAMEAHPQVSLAYCPCIWVDETGAPLYVANSGGHRAHDYLGGRNEVADLLAYDCYITPSAALMRRAVLEQAGALDMNLQGAIDWDLWIRIAEKAPDFAFFKEASVCYRTHGAQDTLRLLSNAGLLEDHVKILQRVIACGNLPLLAGRTGEIITLLRTKFNAFAPDRVAHLRPKIEALEAQLLGQRGFTQGGAEVQQVEASFIAALHGTLEIVDLFNAAEQLTVAGRLDLAAALYRLWLAQSTSPLRYAAAFNLGTVLEKMGVPDEAITAYRLSTQLQPQFDAAQNRLQSLGAAAI